jgi:hypothetical protein
MLVKDLIEELKNFDENTEVHLSYNYGDHWHTQVAPVIKYVNEEKVKYSSYHSMDKVVDDEDESEEVKSVIVLS